MATDTFALTWNVSKLGRGDKKHLKQGRRFGLQSSFYLPLKIRTTRIVYSNRNLQHHDGHTNAETSLPIFCKSKQGKQIEGQHQVTYPINICSLEGGKYTAYYRRTHNLGSSFWEYISKCRESELLTSDIYIPFLVRVSQINYLLRGFNHSRQWTQCREGASTIISEDLYILQSTYVLDWLIVESCPSIRSIGSVTIGTEIPRENIFTSNLCLITREC